jgi:hypothetical protein
VINKNIYKHYAASHISYIYSKNLKIEKTKRHIFFPAAKKILNSEGIGIYFYCFLLFIVSSSYSLDLEWNHLITLPKLDSSTRGTGATVELDESCILTIRRSRMRARTITNESRRSVGPSFPSHLERMAK